jgi:hypothetical protein
MMATRTDPLKSALLVVLALPMGVGLAFLSLEGIGVPLLIVALVIASHVGRRRNVDLPLLSVCFGLGFAATVAALALRTSGIFQGATDTGSALWFGFWFLFGCTLTCGGVGILIRRRASGAASKSRPSTG